MDHPAILVLTGPTASGKTGKALSLAREDPLIEIVNADVQLFYRGFDIGTAKPTEEERSEIPHHFIDTHDASQKANAAEFSRAARERIRALVAEGKKPLVVGGSGLYIDALFEGLMEITIDPEVEQQARDRAMREYEELGFDRLHEALKPIDPILHRQIGRERNPIRLLRAWEFYHATGRSLGEARQSAPTPFEFEPAFEVLFVPRSELWKRIEVRTHEMLRRGWIEEVERLLATGVTEKMPGMNAIGYRAIIRHLRGELTREQTIEEIIIRTRQYAKRQTTWMKRYLKTNDVDQIE